MKVSHLWTATGALLSILVGAFQGGLWFGKWEPGGNGPSFFDFLAKGNPRFRADGLIADFTIQSGGRCLNTLGEVFNIVSDAELLGTSTTQWSRMTEGDNGFLRIIFDLKPNNLNTLTDPADDIEGYGGVWTDLSFPPAKEYNVSSFKKLAVRMRLRGATTVPRVFLALASGNITKDPDHPGHYDWPQYQVQTSKLNPNWVEIVAELAAFKRPEWSERKEIVELDLKKIFRLIVAIKANNNSESSKGNLDIDDVRFVK